MEKHIDAVKLLLRLEGLAVLLVSVLIYSRTDGHWGIFALWFFVPDLAMAGYALGSRAGAVLYNLTHSYIGALLLIAIAVIWPTAVTLPVGIIWMAHIGFDRMLGYGLKYRRGFGFTHLGNIGKNESAVTESE